MKPGKTYFPEASITSVSLPGSMPGSIRVIFSPSQSTSATYESVAVTIRPFLIKQCHGMLLVILLTLRSIVDEGRVAD